MSGMTQMLVSHDDGLNDLIRAARLWMSRLGLDLSAVQDTAPGAIDTVWRLPGCTIAIDWKHSPNYVDRVPVNEDRGIRWSEWRNQGIDFVFVAFPTTDRSGFLFMTEPYFREITASPKARAERGIRYIGAAKAPSGVPFFSIPNECYEWDFETFMRTVTQPVVLAA